MHGQFLHDKLITQNGHGVAGNLQNTVLQISKLRFLISTDYYRYWLKFDKIITKLKESLFQTQVWFIIASRLTAVGS